MRILGGKGKADLVPCSRDSLRGLSTKRPGHFARLGGTDRNLNGLRNDTIDTENLRSGRCLPALLSANSDLVGELGG